MSKSARVINPTLGPLFRFLFLSASLLSIAAQNLTDDQLTAVLADLATGATHSWELGTRAQALTSLLTPSYSVFSDTPLPLPYDYYTYGPPSSLSPVLSLAHAVVANRSMSNGNITGPQPLMNDSASGDPASMGVAFLLANWTGAGGEDYAGAATDQLDFLLYKVPQTSDGAISHRVDQLQLWADFVYMAPPFMAYYAVTTSNRTLLEQAYTQCKLYRSYLRDSSGNGMWKHIVMGSGTDSGHWATGNAWAAQGILRVLTTIQHSQYANGMKNEQKDLAGWVGEIHNAVWGYLSNNLLLNYPDQTSSFSDAASTALLAASVYRLSNAWGTHKWLPVAERVRETLFAASNSTSSNQTLEHFTNDGWLTPVVNPYDWSQQGQRSPEAQAFVVELESAWRDWVQSGSMGANGANRLGAGWGTMAVGIAGVLFVTAQWW